MEKFNQFVEKLKKHPQIQTSVVNHEGKEIEVKTFKCTGETKEETEQTMISGISEVIEGKNVWVRLLPEIAENEQGYVGTARIAFN